MLSYKTRTDIRRYYRELNQKKSKHSELECGHLLTLITNSFTLGELMISRHSATRKNQESSGKEHKPRNETDRIVRKKGLIRFIKCKDIDYAKQLDLIFHIH